MFLDFLHEHLPSFRDRIVPVAERQDPAELAILGFGTNGHVAFHRARSSGDLRKEVVPLSKETLSRLDPAVGHARNHVRGGGRPRDGSRAPGSLRGRARAKPSARPLGRPGDPSALLRAHRDLLVLVDEEVLEESS